MKELSIEQKAKAYDEALRQIKECTPDENGFVTIYPNEIFPELKESEDDRIRNFISNELACLRATTEKGSDRYEELTNAIAWLEKQGEQKPAEWSEEDESNINSIVSRLEVDISYWESRSKTRTNEDKKLINWFNSFKDRVQPYSQWKPSDEQIGLLQAIVNEPNNAASESCQITLKEVIKQLKKLREE